MEMQLEGHPSLSDVTPQQVSRGVDALASPIGPTFIIVEDGAGSYCQAAGTDGRYVLEAREGYGVAGRDGGVPEPGDVAG